MEGGAAMVGAGAQGPGGMEEESGLWGGHLLPLDQLLQPHLRQEREEASDLYKRDMSVGRPWGQEGQADFRDPWQPNYS